MDFEPTPLVVCAGHPTQTFGESGISLIKLCIHQSDNVCGPHGRNTPIQLKLDVFT